MQCAWRFTSDVPSCIAAADWIAVQGNYWPMGVYHSVSFWVVPSSIQVVALAKYCDCIGPVIRPFSFLCRCKSASYIIKYGQCTMSVAVVPKFKRNKSEI